ncbi:MAG: hypothetical protein QOH66_3079 [Actinomycetota bacterium]|nr:hypothetical protein [Actinomycetota bacterium]
MRVLQVIQSLDPGGAERVVVSLARGCQASGHDVAVVAAPGPLADELACPWFDLPMLNRRPQRLPLAAWKIRRAIRATRADVVHAHNPGMAAATALATLGGRQPPAVVSIHGVPDADYPAAGRVLRKAGLPLVACGPGVAAALEEVGCAVRATILNGIAPAAPPGDRVAFLREWALDPTLRLVVSLGRLVTQKNQALAIEAMRSVPDAALVILGEGPLRAELEHVIRDAGLGERVVLAGFRTDASSILAASDAVVVSSRWEGLPLVALEALAARRPLVATAVRGIRELLHDEEQCLLVPPDDPDAMARALRRVLDGPDLAHRLGAAGLLLAQGHTEEEMLGEFLELYRDLVGRGGERPAPPGRRPARHRPRDGKAAPPTAEDPERRPLRSGEGAEEDHCDWSSKKLLYVIQPTRGGSVRHFTDLLGWITDLGAEVHVVCDPDLATIDQVGARAVVWPRRMRREPAPEDPATISFLVRLLRREHFDMVHAHSSKAGALVRVACCFVRPRPRVLYTPHLFGFRNPELSPAVRPVFRLIEKSLVPLTDGIIALCADEEKDARKLAPPDVVFLATNGVEVLPVAARSEPAGGLTLAYVGRLAGMKGVDVLIRALPGILAAEPSATLWVIGDGPERAALELQVAAVGLAGRVDFQGERSDVAELWGSIDILIMPSRAEAQPYVLLEAMMAGRAIVATSVGGMKDLIDSGHNGILVPPDSPGDLAAAVLRLARDPVYRSSVMEGAAHSARERVSLQAMFSSHERIYREVFLTPGRPRPRA